MDSATAADRARKSWANTTDRAARTALARAAFIKQFEDAVDPKRRLPVTERAFLAEQARRDYYARIAAKSVASRAAKRAAKQAEVNP